MPSATDPSPTADSVERSRLVLGIDGGGTKTVAWLAACAELMQPVTIGRGTAGPSNPQAVGPGVAQRNIELAVERAFADARQTPETVAAACLALAGTGREDVRQEMLCWAQRHALARRVQVVHDAQAVLATGTRDGTGVAVICGTGSFAYGESASGTHARSGGWGHLFGDEGSGYAIGRAALRAITRAADSRGPLTLLTTAVLAQLQLTEPQQLIPTIYGSSSTRSTIASLTPCVFQTADDRDQVAVQICQQAAAELAQLVRSVTCRLGLEPGHYDLALAGGVLARQTAWAELLVRTLSEHNCSPGSYTIVQHPVAGAVALAHRACCQ